ncbi:holo-ACP synthase [Brevibacillus ruminantium]|uniref:Holo-[acyl-carrier-protein] synthase n=1 Tax=Brevibacillus ruminantium TaxID=2950604 RepID=A0ABY4WMF3_9BACL|nr:holo-ACP synthase [Brevibacillus ruminantium]USG68322.1 holo-ACP synthase [Brevibacillus ruminantium]
MILGIGTDIVEITRIHTLVKRQPQLLNRIFTESEREQMAGKGEVRLAEYVAGRFAAKEAGAKALGTGIGKTVGFHDMQIISTPSGKPEMTISEAACQRLGRNAEHLRVHLSISHSKEYAVAQVVLEWTEGEAPKN